MYYCQNQCKSIFNNFRNCVLGKADCPDYLFRFMLDKIVFQPIVKLKHIANLILQEDKMTFACPNPNCPEKKFIRVDTATIRIKDEEKTAVICPYCKVIISILPDQNLCLNAINARFDKLKKFMPDDSNILELIACLKANKQS